MMYLQAVCVYISTHLAHRRLWIEWRRQQKARFQNFWWRINQSVPRERLKPSLDYSMEVLHLVNALLNALWSGKEISIGLMCFYGGCSGDSREKSSIWRTIFSYCHSAWDERGRLRERILTLSEPSETASQILGAGITWQSIVLRGGKLALTTLATF
jgi:hypothetical protein